VPVFAWNDTYSVGVPQMDDQHKKLFVLMNNLHEAMAQRKAADVMGPILKALADYAVLHFQAEEAMLAAADSELLGEQKAAHQAFVKKVQDFRARFDQGQVGLSLEMMNFLKDWLVRHIQQNDQKYKPAK
jgi:hemerythrin